MRKTFSILLAVLIIASSVHLTFSAHFCRNSFQGVKVSVTGEKAGCGMESAIPACKNERTIGHNCCSDKQATYLINDNYSPANFHYFKITHADFVVLKGITMLNFLAPVTSSLQIAHAPPGEFLLFKPELASICIFQI